MKNPEIRGFLLHFLWHFCNRTC